MREATGTGAHVSSSGGCEDQLEGHEEAKSARADRGPLGLC